jgi:hypothetical protein
LQKDSSFHRYVLPVGRQILGRHSDEDHARGLVPASSAAPFRSLTRTSRFAAALSVVKWERRCGMPHHSGLPVRFRWQVRGGVDAGDRGPLMAGNGYFLALDPLSATSYRRFRFVLLNYWTVFELATIGITTSSVVHHW